MRVPSGCAQGSGSPLAPSSTLSAKASVAPRARVRISSRETEAIEGSASPRKPSVAMWVEVAVGDFRGRVALDAELEIGGVHADAVVADPDEVAPAGLDRDLDAARARVERVLDEFLHRRCRTLDHFAGGDAVDQQRIEAADVQAQLRSARAAASRRKPGDADESRHDPSPAFGRRRPEGPDERSPTRRSGRPTIATLSEPSPNSRSAVRRASAIVTAAMRRLRSTSHSTPWPSSWICTSWPAILVEVSKRSG